VERKEEDIKTQRHEEGIYFEAQRHEGEQIEKQNENEFNKNKKLDPTALVRVFTQQKVLG
jgi:hypothetical protein